MKDGDHVSTMDSTGARSSPSDARRVQLHIDDRSLHASYTNAFRTRSTPEEIVIDFGFNIPTQSQQNAVSFKMNDRIIMNYTSARRLIATLAQLVRRHDEQFGTPAQEPPKEPAPNDARPKKTGRKKP